MRKRSWGEILSVVLVGVVLLGAGIALLVMNLGGLAVRPSVVIEAGSDELSPELFLKDPSMNGSFVSDISALSLSKIGTYDVQVQVNGRTYTSSLTVQDTTAPAAVALPREIGLSQRLEAKDLVEDIRDATAVKVAFKEMPAFGVEGVFSVPLVLTDAGGNQSEITSQLTVSRVRAVTEVDAYREVLKADSFLLEPDEQAVLLTDTAPLFEKGLGDYPVQVKTGNRVYSVTMRVADFSAPQAAPRTVTVWEDTTATNPMDFVKKVKDISKVTASFVKEPVYGTVGEQNVTVRLTDAKGNYTDVISTLRIVTDTEPPVIIGVADREVVLGETVSYKKGVSATDNKDGDVTVKVDSSKVNLDKEGTYTVRFIAEDAAGNKTVAKQKLVVLPAPEITMEQVQEQADKVLNRIVKADMTANQKAEAIYNWVIGNLYYSDSLNDTDWITAAYHGFTLRRGDCFQFYAVTKVLLDSCGVDNMKITRTKKASTKHFWLLVNTGSGWYHMDTTPHHIRSPFRCFMKTDKEIWDYAASRVDGRKDYYDFDTAKYPARAKKAYTE